MRKEKDIGWHTFPLEEVFKTLKTSSHGLRENDAKVRLEQTGLNRLPQPPAPTKWEIFLRQFRSPLIYILGLAALVSAIIGAWKDASFIAAVLLINATLGSYQEWQAEQNSRALQQLLKIRASVIRSGETCELDAQNLVPGDLVCLESGNRVPADIRLFRTHNLEIDESPLTGESLPILKDSGWRGAESTPLADRLNMAYGGSMVVRGRGRAVVVATGSATMVGQLATELLTSVEGKPPLVERLEDFSRRIAIAVLVAAIIVGLIGIFKQGYSLTEMFLFGVALAVSAIPEGLPVAITVALAIATNRMARQKVIVRRLPAVEGLGSCSLIATDKTGTLTCNELTVRTIYTAEGNWFDVTGKGFAPQGKVLFQQQEIFPESYPTLNALARTAVLCNEADLHHRHENWVWRGDPTDIAMLSLAHKLRWNQETALEEYPQVNEIPFEPEHRFAATYHHIAGKQMVFVKGAPERVLSMCDLSSHSEAEELSAIARQLAVQGYRVLALAEGTLREAIASTQSPPQPSQLKFLGFAGAIDPLRSEVKEAIAACHAAGILVWMVTGDHPSTALAIARELGLATKSEQVVTGTELLDKSPEQLKQILENSCVFARVAPAQKLQLVQTAQKLGHFVAVTGDGVNDAPALRAANIGVAMGKSGTDVAREAAELVISDDHFASIVAGIIEGRIAYNNIRKVIYLLVSTGASQIILVGLAFSIGLPLPLLPVQLLWLNLVTNGIQDVALAFEPSEGDVLRHRPRSPKEPFFNRLMLERTFIAACVMGIVSFSTFEFLLDSGMTEASARNALLLLMVLFGNVHIANCRSEEKSAFQLPPWRSPILLIGAFSALVIHVMMLHLPLGHALLDTQPVNISLWKLLFPLSLTVLVAIELHKLLRYLIRRS